MQMRADFGMNTDPVCAISRKELGLVVGIGHHQVDVQWQRGERTNPLEDHRAEGDGRHKVTIHHINVENVGTALFAGTDVAFEMSEVSREKRRGDLHNQSRE